MWVLFWAPNTNFGSAVENPREFLISSGDVTVRGEDFGLRLADRTAAGTFAKEFADILAALLGSGGVGEHQHRPYRRR